jgi:signal transduction histidine kinase
MPPLTPSRSDPPAPPRPSAVRTAAVVFATATGFGFLETLKGFVGTRLRGQPLGWTVLLFQNLPWWYTWALFTPIVFWAARRFPIVNGQAALRRIPLHALLAVLLSSLHLWITAPLYYATNPALVKAPNALAVVSIWHANYLIPNVVTYAMILGAFHWVLFYRRYHDEVVTAAQLMARTAVLERGLTEARIEALQRELNPHFLFNSLNAVAGLIRRSEPAAAIGMLSRLGDLLRTTLDPNLPTEIPLATELELLGRYIAIETTRFADRLTVTLLVPPELGRVSVPALSLQPLFENAIRHGVARQPGPGTVTLRARADGGRLRLDVSDTGPGFPADVLASERAGVGLSNTRARLAELYGAAGQLAIGNRPEGGGVATIWIPLERSVGAPSLGDKPLAPAD